MATVKRMLAGVLGIGLLAVAGTAYAATPATVGLGTAGSFAILAGTPAITSTGPSVIIGDVGIHPALAITGFPPGVIIGNVYAGGAIALQAKSDLVIAYDDAAGRTPVVLVANGTLGSSQLVGGVYNSAGFTFDLTGTLTLDGQNDPNSVWIFQATSDLITASSSRVQFINGGSPCNVFWQVTSSATLGSGSTFVGNILALTSITMNDNVTVAGRALARNGTVTLINDRISAPSCAAVPNPTPAPVVTPTPVATPTPAPSATPTSTVAPTTGASATPIVQPVSLPTAAATSTTTPTVATGAPTLAPSNTAPVVNAPGIVTVVATPNLTLPPTDTDPLGDARRNSSTFGGALVLLGGLLVLASAVIVRTRPARR